MLAQRVVGTVAVMLAILIASADVQQVAGQQVEPEAEPGPGNRDQAVPPQDNWPASDDEIEPVDLDRAKLLDETLAHLRLYPRDAYAQYVALLLARREGRLSEIATELRRNPQRNRQADRQNSINLFSIFSGQLAVQESLQLDAMAPVNMPRTRRTLGRRAGPPPVQQAGGSPDSADEVLVSSLVGPTIKRHPWRKMLSGRSPTVSGLALNVPSDFYFVSFRSLNQLLDTLDLTTIWSDHAIVQANQEARTQLVNERLRKQLAIETGPALRPFYDEAVDEVAVAGSDLFVREGSDVTILFRLNQPVRFRKQMAQFLTTAERSRGDAQRSVDEYLGIEYVHVATPDRQIHVYAADPTDDLHVRSNSRAGLERILQAIVGRGPDGAPVERLGSTDEFRYVRTLLPQGAAEEDGLIYLSDPFVRQLMSPELRLTQRRRMVCYNHLRMIGHAALMYRALTGETASSISDLSSADCTPGEFGRGRLACPEHGDYTLSADGITGICSKHGYPGYLTPCSEIEVTHVTNAEAGAYRRFVTEYSRYWRQFFDPIAIRVQLSPQRFRAETIVLPLINNTIYANLARVLGVEPEHLDRLPVPDRNVFSFYVRLDKSELLAQLGMEELLETSRGRVTKRRLASGTARSTQSLTQLSLGIINYESAKKRFPPAALVKRDGRSLLSWRVLILPWLGQQELYDQFRLDEPWDSEHNRRLVRRMPEVFRPRDKRLAAEGRTRFVVPRGKENVFHSDNQGTRLHEIRDGVSQTVLLLEADDAHAVIWTKPEDLEIGPSQPQRGLHVRPSGNFLAAFCDGSSLEVSSEIDQSSLVAMLTRDGGEPSDWRKFTKTPPWQPRRSTRSGRWPRVLVDELGLDELLLKGLGNQIGFHAYDADPMFDLDLARFMGVSFSSFPRGMQNQLSSVIPLVAALNGPVYFSIPVENQQTVDGFLDRLDNYLAALARRIQGEGFLRIDQDFYRLRDDGGNLLRVYGIQFGPFKWRFFWNRIGDAVYVASKREVLEDLAKLDAAHRRGRAEEDTNEDVAQALVRLRPRNWDQVLAAYRLAWEENRRDACLANLGPMSSLHRALGAGGSNGVSISDPQFEEYAARVFGARHFCPDGGRYEVTSDGRAACCSVHGTAHQPRQPAAPTTERRQEGESGGIRDVSIRFMFLEDGLRAIATLELQPGD